MIVRWLLFKVKKTFFIRNQAGPSQKVKREPGSSLGPTQNVEPEPSKKKPSPPGRARAEPRLGPITIRDFKYRYVWEFLSFFHNRVICMNTSLYMYIKHQKLLTRIREPFLEVLPNDPCQLPIAPQSSTWSWSFSFLTNERDDMGLGPSFGFLWLEPVWCSDCWYSSSYHSNFDVCQINFYKLLLKM